MLFPDSFERNNIGGIVVKTQEAVVMRIKGLCEEKNIKISQLAYISGMPPSTLKNVMQEIAKIRELSRLKQYVTVSIFLWRIFSAAKCFGTWSRKLIRVF